MTSRIGPAGEIKLYQPVMYQQKLSNCFVAYIYTIQFIPTYLFHQLFVHTMNMMCDKKLFSGLY